MLSYRHVYHAGNHADVLKHITQIVLLDLMAKKNKPMVYIDTHAAAGCYDLSSEEANKTGEYLSGVAHIKDYDGLDPYVLKYQQMLANSVNAGVYPGSVFIAGQHLGDQDQIICIEKHNNEIELLRNNVRKAKRAWPCQNVAIHHRDAFEALVALTPPTPKRGLVLIDPSYELMSDYSDVITTLKKALLRWSNGVYAVWYPILSGRSEEKQLALQTMKKQCQKLSASSILDIELLVQDLNEGEGMCGSGILLINPPWEFEVEIESVLRAISNILAKDLNSQGYSLDWLKLRS